MKSITAFLHKVASFFACLFTPANQAKVAAALGKAEGLIELALPIVASIASLTPTRADDEIIAVVKMYCDSTHVPAGPLTDEQKGDLLFNAAAAQLKKVIANKAGITESILDLAVQLAYTAFHATKV